MEKNKNNTIEEYISKFPKEIQRLLKQVRATIKNAAPEAEEEINYAIPTFKLNGNLVHFAAFKNHIGFYPSPSALKTFQKEISIYKSSKGAVQFPIDKPMPLILITKIVKYKLKENLANDKNKKRK